MKGPPIDQELLQRCRDVLGDGCTVDAELPQIVWRGAARRPQTRRVSGLSQYQVESAVLHAAVSARCAGEVDGSSSFLILGAPNPPKDSGRHLVQMLTAAGCPDFRFAIITPHGPHLVRWEDGPAQEREGDQPVVRPHPAQRGFSCAPAQFWVLRALLLTAQHARGWWPGPLPVTGTWASATELALAGNLSTSLVARTIKGLEERSWVVKERAGFRVLDPAALLQACAQEGARRWGRRQPMRLTRSDAQGAAVVQALGDLLRDHVARASCAETGWGALGRHRLAVSAPSARLPELVLTGAGGPVLAACPMIPASLRDAQVVVHLGALPVDIPAAPGDGLPVVDPVLALFHVAGDPQGGQEQAAHLQERIVEALNA